MRAVKAVLGWQSRELIRKAEEVTDT